MNRRTTYSVETPGCLGAWALLALFAVLLFVAGYGLHELAIHSLGFDGAIGPDCDRGNPNCPLPARPELPAGAR